MALHSEQDFAIPIHDKGFGEAAYQSIAVCPQIKRDAHERLPSSLFDRQQDHL